MRIGSMLRSAATLGLLLFLLVPGSAAAHQCGFLDLFCDPNHRHAAPAPAPDPGGVESPDQAVPPPGKPFGFNVPDASFSNADGEWGTDRAVDALHAAGATVVRTVIQWEALNSTPRDLDPTGFFESAVGELPVHHSFRRFDDLYLEATSRGMTPIFVVMDAPEWASRFAECANFLFELDEYRCPRDREWRERAILFPASHSFHEWAALAAGLAKRYPDAIFEGWNEPYNAWYLNYFSRVPGGEMADIHCVYHDAIKAVRPDATVLSPSMRLVTGGGKPKPRHGYFDAFYRRVASTRPGGCHDVQAVHFYPGVAGYGEDSSLAWWFRSLREFRAKHGETRPIWQTETGWSDTYDSTTSREQVDAALRRLYNRIATIEDIDGFLFHTLRDAPLPGYGDPSNREYGLGWLAEDWTPKGRFCSLVARAGRSAYPGCSG